MTENSGVLAQTPPISLATVVAPMVVKGLMGAQILTVLIRVDTNRLIDRIGVFT